MTFFTEYMKYSLSLPSSPNRNLLGTNLFESAQVIISTAYTGLLFTWTDYKTIFLPILVFACSTAPVRSFGAFCKCCVWIWIHLLLCNVSNQACSKDEDMLNRPWRPLPAGRVSVTQAENLRLILAVFCVFTSALYHRSLALASLSLLATTIIYDDVGLAGHVVGKNFCNIFGYGSFQAGAVIILNEAHVLDYVSWAAIVLNGILIFTTIQMQDFPDVAGDAAIGRITFPIYAPEFSRWVTLAAMLFWPTFLAWFWQASVVGYVCFLGMGAWVGARCFSLRSADADAATYRLYNVWLIATFLLPANVRNGVSISL